MRRVETPKDSRRLFSTGMFVLVCATFVRAAPTSEHASRTPWPPQYKIKPNQKARLTAADVLGPDGIVYPNWTRCGVQGGIPKVGVAAKIEDFGARADDQADDSQALRAACEAVGRAGGAVLLGAGTYYLDRPVTIRRDNLVIRGAGPSRTRLIFRYAIPDSKVTFFNPLPNSRVGRDTRIEMNCEPAGLTQMIMTVDGAVIGEWTRGQHSGNTFAFAIRGRDVIGKVSDGRHVLRGIAKYRDGSSRRAEIPIVLDSKFRDTRSVPDSRAVITFAGQGTVGPRLKLAEDGKRGDKKLRLQTTQTLRAGDCILIDGPATDRWKKLTKNACKWGMYRNYEVVVTAVEGKTVSINQPLRIEFPVIDGSYVRKVIPIRRCGIENLYLEQTENLWITGVLFSNGWNCWARSVTVKKCGRFPVYGTMAKWCEIRDCIFDDSWFKGGGGTAYTGWDRCWDCLIENVETFKMRHAPLFQWAASGCVIRKSVFHESDAQWHAGWTNENLMEQCVVESVRGHGGYGFGMWASPPRDAAHGPNGPRNVVYNCDVSSQKTGLWMGGMNENWLILYTRFLVDSGPGVFAGTASFDHIIKANTFILKDGKSPMIHLATADCVGVEAVANKVYGGSGDFVSGPAGLAIAEHNQALPLSAAPRPRPKAPSIYQWQKQNVSPP